MSDGRRGKGLVLSLVVRRSETARADHKEPQPQTQTIRRREPVPHSEEAERIAGLSLETESREVECKGSWLAAGSF